MANTQRLGSIWKGRAWDDGETIPRVTFPDGTIGEAMAALGYLWNGAAFVKAIGDATTGTFVGGAVASAATDSGNPVKIGGKYNSTLPTFTDGQRGDLQMRSRGQIPVSIYHNDGTANPVTGTDVQADARNPANGTVNSASFTYVFNGSSWDRVRGDTTNGAYVNVTKVAAGEGRTLLFGAITQGAAGTTSLVGASAANKVKVVSYMVVLDAAGSFQFTDGTANMTGVIPVAANSGAVAVSQPSSHLFETAAINRALSITTVTGKAFGHFSYFLEP